MFVATLWAAVTVNFFIPRLMPGTPADAALAKLAGTGPVSPAQKQAIEDTLGVPHTGLVSQYWHYLDDAAHGRFGISYTYFPEPVTSLIRTALPWTLVLVGSATVLAFVVGTLAGVLAAWRRGRVIDAVSTVGSTFTSAFPYFWTALLLLFVFAFKLNWFPIKGGYRASVSPNWSPGFVADAAFHSVLPALTILIILGLGGWLLGMRNMMVDTLGEDYVHLARPTGCAAARSRCATPPATRCCPTSPGSGCRWASWSPDRSLTGAGLRLSGHRLPAAATGRRTRLPADAGALPGDHGQRAGAPTSSSTCSTACSTQAAPDVSSH